MALHNHSFKVVHMAKPSGANVFTNVVRYQDFNKDLPSTSELAVVDRMSAVSCFDGPSPIGHVLRTQKTCREFVFSLGQLPLINA